VTDIASRPATGADPDPTPAGESHRSLPLNKAVFAVAAAAVLAFVLWGALTPEDMGETTTTTLTWLEKTFGWLFVLTTAAFVIFSGYLALSRYGNVRLGPDDAEPEFSTFSWVSMMFATGMGIGLIFWGVAEPLTHLNTPPLGMAEAGSPAAARLAMAYTFFHWGLHPWSIYAVIGLKDTTTGDTLCDEKASIVLEPIDFPEPVVHVAIEPKTWPHTSFEACILRAILTVHSCGTWQSGQVARTPERLV